MNDEEWISTVLTLQYAFVHQDDATTLIGMSMVKRVKKNLIAIGTEPDQKLLDAVLNIFEPVKDIKRY